MLDTIHNDSHTWNVLNTQSITYMLKDKII